MSVRFDASCLLLSALLAGYGLHRCRAIAATQPATVVAALPSASGAPDRPDADSLDDAAATIVANNPFRLSNKPSSVRFTTTTVGVPPVVQVRPQLALRAIIGGPPWSAIVDGIPGQAGGVIVSAGVAFDMVRIRSITRDAVVVQAPDTTWTLTMKPSP